VERPRLQNPYLAYFRSLPAACRRDPHAPSDYRDLVAPGWIAFKNAVVSAFSWAVPTDEAVFAIARRATRVLEIGAGSGYWSWQLAQAGVDVLAVDAAPPPTAWHRVWPGNEFEAATDPSRALLLCWPPWNTAMALNALLWHAGDTVIYIGEWNRGSAEPRFFDVLSTAYDLVETVAIPQWWERTDVVTIHRRKT
jgi:hypothetical protein